MIVSDSFPFHRGATRGRAIFAGATEGKAIYYGSKLLWNVAGWNSLWTPAALGSSLALWLDAAESSTITLNGSTVSQWNDKSGNGRHVSQTTAAIQPTYSATGMLGNPTLDWGANINNISLSLTGMTGYSPVRYFGVADHDGANPFSEYAGLVSHNYTSITDVLVTDHGTNNFYSEPAGSGRTHSYFLNGSTTPTLVALPTINSPFLFATNFTQNPNRTNLLIGHDRFIDARGWRGKISEIIALNTLPSTTDHQRLEGYLAWKWGLQANLPSGHPFKNSPPYLQ